MAGLLSWIGNTVSTGYHDVFGGGQPQQQRQAQQPQPRPQPQPQRGPVQLGGVQVNNPLAARPQPAPAPRPVPMLMQPQQPIQINTTQPIQFQPQAPALPANTQIHLPTPAPVQAQPAPQPQHQDNRSGWSKLWDQVNPLDNGRTWKDSAPTPNADHSGSAIHQLTHGGAANATGMVVHSVTNVPAAAVNMGRGMYSQATGDQANAQKQYALALQDAHNNLVTGLAQTAYYVPKAFIADPAVSLMTKDGTAAHQIADQATMQDLNKTPFGQLLNPVQQKAIENNVQRNNKNLTPAQQKQLSDQIKTNAGLDPNASLGKQALTSGLGAAQLVIPEKLVNGVPIAADVANKGAAIANTARSISNAVKPGAKDAGVTSAPIALSQDAAQSAPKSAAPKANATQMPSSSPNNTVAQISDAVAQARAAGADDAKIKQILENGTGSNRSANVRQIEQQQAHLTDAQRLQMANGDTGQAGLPMAADQHAAMLKAFQEKAAASSTTPAAAAATEAPKFTVGQAIKTNDRGNQGVITKDNGDGSYQVRFVNRSQGTKATVKIHGDNLTERGAPAQVPKNAPNATLPNGNKLSRNANVTVQNSDNFTPLVKNLTAAHEAQYTPVVIKEGQAKANEFVSSHPDATAAVLNKLESPLGHISFQDALNTHAVVEKLQATGNPDDSLLAANMLAKLSEHHTAAGQLNSAAAAMSRRTPLGIRTQAQKVIENGGKGGAKQEITPQLSQKLDEAQHNLEVTDKAFKQAQADHAAAEKAANEHFANGTYQKGELDQSLQALREADSKQIAAHEDLKKLVSENIHHSVGSKAFALWRTGLLTGPRTYAKVMVSHTGMGVLEQAKQLPATALDMAISGGHQLVKGGSMRSTTFAPNRGLGGLARGAKATKDLLIHGHDTPGTGGREGTFAGAMTHTDVKFKGTAGKILNPYMEKTAQGHAAIPKMAYTYARDNSMYKQAYAAAKNLGYKGEQKAQFIDKYVNSVSNKVAMDEAAHDGQFAAFQQPNSISKIGQGIQRTPGGRVIMPFASIASTLLADAIHYSPAALGVAGVNVAKALRSGEGWTPRVQKQFVEELGRGITGTGVGVIGYELAKHGLMTGGYPTNPTERKLWEAEGKTPNSIKIGGKWRSTSTLEPAGSLLAAGEAAYTAGTSNAKGKSQLIPAVTGVAQDLTSQSYLSGLTGLSDAIAHPTQYGTKFLKQQASSVVPNVVATVASATDPLQRNTTGFTDAVESKIPGLRETLTPKSDMFGNTLQRQGGVATGLFDPTRPSTAVNDPTVNEVQRIYDATGTAPVPAQVKSINAKDANGNKTQVPLNTQQQYDYSKTTGPEIKQAYQQAISDPNYAGLTDANKAAVLDSLKNKIQLQNKASTVQSIDSGKTVKVSANEAAPADPSAAVQKEVNKQANLPADTNKDLAQNYKDVLAKYDGMNAQAKTKAFNSDPGAEYAYNMAKYENAKANGTLSTAADIKAQDALAKDQVGAAYDKNIRELYGLNKADLYKYLTNDPNGSAIYGQLVSYDNALKDAGIITSAKFKNGLSTKSTTGYSRGSGNSSGTRSGRVAGTKRLTLPHVKSAPKLAVYHPKGMKVPKMPKTRTTTRSKIPSYAMKTPKITRKAIA